MSPKSTQRTPDCCLELLEVLRADGFVKPGHATLTVLTGGVSSNVVLVNDCGHEFVVKQALSRLRVKDTWYADVSRNRYEREYLTYVSGLCPGAVPAMLGSGEGYFAMEYLGDGFSTWKERLLAGDFNELPAVAAGRTLGLIHRQTSGNKYLARQFDTTANFHQLRIDPYLLTTGVRHPALRRYFEIEAERLKSTRECLIHGDYSPKNLLYGRGRLVILDCEVAWYGDPAFDLAFLISHLLLKALYRQLQRTSFRVLAEAAIHAYFHERSLPGEEAQRLDVRTARLLLLLMLARVDGKSPVEYLGGEQQHCVRRFVATTLETGKFKLASVMGQWFQAIEIMGSGELR